MLPTDAITTLATYAAAVPGLAEAQYPAKGLVQRTPALVLFWDETIIAHGSEQVWAPLTVKGQLLVALKGETQREIAKADPLVAPLVDAFAAGTDGFKLRSGAGSVDHCMIVRVVPSLVIGYAGHEYYGCELYWQIKVRRKAGES